ncbi:hypothetical protein GOODEAATRI_005057 [Goodea atripinnis]|uniref:Uncharacterized protein n=1 Tax=Goodea atripinnis TaxID=208336 RepID=A0ABV0NJZ8_9TELE
MQGQESMGRWDGLCSRDASSRAEAMEFICQEVMRKVEAIGPIKAANPSSPAPGSRPNTDLNGILVQLLMLSRRCPFEDVRERCAQLLQDIQNHVFVKKLSQLITGSFLGCFLVKTSDRFFSFAI